jgi:predicted dehydrogenase
MSKVKTIVVIGAGNLGIRHLQSLCGISHIENFYILDPSTKSLENAKKIFEESSTSDIQQLHLIQSANLLPLEIDFAVVATNSLIRREVIAQLLDKSRVKYLILEKFLFPRIEDYQVVERLLADTNTKAWVNCGRRMFDFYQQLRSQLNPNSPTVMLVNAGNLSVGTHAIHFLDLFAFLTNSQVLDDIDLSLVHPIVYESKRPGYIEFKGTIVAKAGTSTMIFQTFEDSNMPLQIIVNQPDKRFEILEHEFLIRSSTADSKWQWQENPMDKPLQSRLTGMAALQLEETDSCQLPTYQESALLHMQLLKALLGFMNDKLNIHTDTCNIT